MHSSSSSSASSWPSASSASSLCHLSFYTCLGNPFPCHDWGFIPATQKGWLTTGFTNDTALVKSGAAAGIASMFYIGDIFFEFGKGLRPDHAERWQAQAPEVEALVAAGQIVGFFVGDELVSGKDISWEDVVTAVRVLNPLKKKYEHLFVWQNEGGTAPWRKPPKLQGGKIPAEIDVISIDAYSLSPNATRQWYEDTLYPLLNTSTQRVFVVPGSFGSRVDPKKTLAEFSAEMVADAHTFHQWALGDPMLYGIAPWHWEARKVGQTSAYKEVGTSEMPALVAAWSEIGRAVGKRRAAGGCATFPPRKTDDGQTQFHVTGCLPGHPPPPPVKCKDKHHTAWSCWCGSWSLTKVDCEDTCKQMCGCNCDKTCCVPNPVTGNCTEPPQQKRRLLGAVVAPTSKVATAPPLPCVVNGRAKASCFGAANTTDSTEILQAALSSGAKYLLVDNIGRPWQGATDRGSRGLS
jgi:hypothetical protein